ncbi:Hsp20/alpha crystallin family protein [Aquimarina sp. ERC-38]|uniref:Hsp20/alpha crystallin family protein n=1 Tax=Aquimarina sp. ERC-38 TaxID=2949996 RepID=UPI002244FEA5|nr:Hsp20/alpha crystallin family protein [Aquimarina sp. ERC-38]UZO80788.1 Hsp20/alpha crystallin family protein [Aquimarina sp. ERC-38]
MSLLAKTNRLPVGLDDFFNTDWFGGTTNHVNRIGFNTPAINIKETDDSFHIYLAAPGVAKDDFKIELDNENLSVFTEKQNQEETSSDKYTRKEFGYASFKRTFKLPESIDGTSINAAYNNGILEVTLPKKEEAKVQPKRMIEIS